MNPRLPLFAALAGMAAYLFQAWQYAQTQSSVMDEGLYLVKGLFFARGTFTPFQDYGFWTNQMPLAFLIPGWVQLVFGPGLLTGRIYALALACLALIGFWLVARRLSTDWLAAGAIWALALNPAQIKMYTPATAQVLIAAMLAWVLYLTLGPGRPLWKVLAGAALAAAMVLTRVNLSPLVPLLVLYIFWEHGKKAGWMAAAIAALVIAGGHALFWPGILRIWAAWAPTDLTPFLLPFRPPAGQPFWSPVAEDSSRLLSFVFALRFHFLSFTGALLASGLAWKANFWRSPGQYRAAVLLVSAFFVLAAAHAWASLGSHSQTNEALGGDYCVFCFPVYSGFYSLIGVLLLAMVLSTRPLLGRLHAVLAGVLLVVMPLLVGFGGYAQIYPVALRWRIPRLRTLLTTGQWLPGDVALWDFLNSRFDIPVETARRLVPALLGLAAGIALLAVAWIAARRLARADRSIHSFAAAAGMSLVITGLLLSPTALLGRGYVTYDCSGSVLAAHTTVGAHLSEIIPARAVLLWRGSHSPAPLLYLDDPQILAPQTNQDYSLRLSGDDDALLRYGFWSQTIALDWLSQSDFALVAPRYYEGWLQAALDSGSWEELAPTVPLAPCDQHSFLRIFRRVEP